MRSMRAAVLTAMLTAIALPAFAEDRSVGTVDAPGAATGVYMGGRPGVEQPLRPGAWHHHHHHLHHRHVVPRSDREAK